MAKKIKAIDGNTAAGYIGYMCSEIAAIYPITPSSPMAEYGDELAAAKTKNIFGEIVKFAEMQSEAGAAGAVHGALSAGALTTTYTASQGLLLMIPNMYKIAGEKLPCVFHVSARTIAAHALNIFGDHSDVMATRQTGFIMLASNNVQEVMDLAFISHVATYKCKLPILHFFDGFRTSHEINNIEMLDESMMKEMMPINEINEFKKQAHNPNHPKQTGTAQNPDIFFQSMEASNHYYTDAYKTIVKVMEEFKKHTGREYHPFQYVGHPDANAIIIAMGSGCDTISEVVEQLNKEGRKVGLLKVHLYRPFNAEALVKCLPKTVKKITVLDRTKEPGSLGEPLYLDVIAALKESKVKAQVYAGRYGLGGKDFIPEDVISIFDNMKKSKGINHFSVGIIDDVHHTSLPQAKHKFVPLGKYYEMKFFGLGSDGTVSANKSSIKIVSDNTSKFVQGYFEYDSKKSGSLTTSHLRMSDVKFQTPYLVKNADFIAVHNYAFVHQYDLLDGLKQGGCVLLNTSLSNEQLGRDLPKEFKNKLKKANAKLYVIPAFDVAKAANLGTRINVIMQACFFKITNIILYELAEKEMKDFATKSYAKKGPAILEANMKAIDAATTDLREVDIDSLIKIKSVPFTKNVNVSNYYKNFAGLVNARMGNNMKVSEMSADGSVPSGTTQYEKRGIGLNVPIWANAKCVACGMCVLVCPHASLRAFLIKQEDLDKKPSSLSPKKLTVGPNANANFAIQCSPLDCTGCGVCANTCPTKSLTMTPTINVSKDQETNWEYVNSIKQDVNKAPINTSLGVQFNKPYFEFSGACAGCGETPYVGLVSRLFGKSMIIANATGCSSIYGGSAPTNPYTTDEHGCGPSWANSLFEDNAEFGYGMRLAIDYQTKLVYQALEKVCGEIKDAQVIELANEIKQKQNQHGMQCKIAQLIEKLKNVEQTENVKYVITHADQLSKKSSWIFGGDGWAYDIGYGGLDHVIAQNENVNILVLDTEVYSNTGGQASKSTPAGSIAKFAANGKVTRKKDLGLIAMSYKNVYVAQVALGANPGQLIKALIEAESYDGPSLIIAYAPCINHGINLANSIAEEKKAVETGYWTLYRYDPRKPNAPLTIDSPEPTKPYSDFLSGEQRYVSLTRKSPEHASVLFAASEKEAKERRETLKQMLASQNSKN